MAAEGERAGGGVAWEIGVGRCRLSKMELISSKCLLYDTENSVQYLMINYNGKRIFHIYVFEALWYTAVINTTL